MNSSLGKSVLSCEGERRICMTMINHFSFLRTKKIVNTKAEYWPSKRGDTIQNNIWDNNAALDKLAELSIKTGVALTPGQDLLITAPYDAAPLVRRLAYHAYKEGAGIVTPFFSDPEVTMMRYKHARKESFDHATHWLFDGMAQAFDANTARLAVVGEDPMLLSQQNPENVGRANQALSKASFEVRERITRFELNWNIIAWPGLAWAKQVFPTLSDIEAQ